ncbi:MAG: transcription factor E [Archaeoglobaceae archaeon]|nr:transcription factor E [Archaeoglobaceae archaeon]MCX8151822.1 transcription factor E [Archaeoglobaceae archaeon]MDW8014346.1 transcription factor E [Archaeoglobaceae archaeon]
MKEIDVDKLVLELVGRVAGEIGTILYSLQLEDEFTDDKLALELGIDISEIRKALFAMYEIGIAEYKRKRDDETGWMEYYWRINYSRAREVLKRELEKTKKKLEEKIDSESNAIFYICPNYCIKVSYDDAIELNFYCPKCGSMLNYLDCENAIRNLKEEIKKIDEILKTL